MDIAPHLALADKIGDILGEHHQDDVLEALLIVLCYVLRQRGVTIEQTVPAMHEVWNQTAAAFIAAKGKMN